LTVNRWRWFSVDRFDRVAETDPNQALEALNSESREVVDDWLRSEGLETGSEEFLEAVSGGEDKSLAVPRFFGARNLEQTAMYASMSALFGASREVYGEGFDLEVLPWDDEFNPQVPGNRILAEPAVLVTGDRMEEMGLDEDARKRMHNLDVEQVGEDGYLLNFRNFGEFQEKSSMAGVESAQEQGEPVFLANALGIDYSEVERPLDYFTESSPLPETGPQDLYQRQVLEQLFATGNYPASLKLKKNGEIKEVRRRNGGYVTDSGEDVSEPEVLENGMMEASGNYSFLVGPQQVSGLNYIWNGGWPDSGKFRTGEAENFLEAAEKSSEEVRIPSIGDLKESVPEGLREAALTADYSNCAQNPYEKGEAVSNLLISDEVVSSDLVADYVQEIVRAEEEEAYEPTSLEEFGEKVMNRVAETYGVKR
jgi:hypothetical protein